MFLFISVLKGNRWFIQTTKRSLPKGLFAKMWAGLKKMTRDGAQPQGWQRWGTVSSLSLEGHQVEAVTGTHRQSCAVAEEPETGTMSSEDAATAPKRATSVHSPSFFIS